MDWTTFTKRITVKADILSLYAAWTTQKGLESWFLRKAEFSDKNNKLLDPKESFKEGDHYYWLWHGYDDSTFEKGQILSANGMDELSFTFEECIVKVSLKAIEGYTLIELVQSQIATDDQTKMNTYNGCGTGWTFYMTNLKSIYEGGLDLRNKDQKLKNVINA